MSAVEHPFGFPEEDQSKQAHRGHNEQPCDGPLAPVEPISADSLHGRDESGSCSIESPLTSGSSSLA